MVHATAQISAEARLGTGTHVWSHTHIREGAQVGDACVLGEHVYIDVGVRVGNRVKIQNAALLYHGLTVEDGVFIGPRACFTNDRIPRAINPDGTLKGAADWTVGKTVVRYGASIGAGAVVLPGVTVGRFAMVGAGAVVADDVADHALVLGVPARQTGWVCVCGATLQPQDGGRRCPRDGWQLPESTAR